MKTAIEELIEQLQIEIDICEEQGLKYRGIYLDAKWKAEMLLEKEKEQIENAYIQGFCHCQYTGILDFKKYFKDTFKK